MQQSKLKKRSVKEVSSKVLRNIKAIAMDVDGVLTDGVIYLDGQGEEFKSFYALDGLGIVLAKGAGLKIAFISARKSKVLELRAKELEIDAFYQNHLDKKEAFDDLLNQFNLKPYEVCYIGDDLIDIPILKRSGFPVAVLNAVCEVKDCASYVTKKSGGRGAVREVVEKIMKAQGRWEEVLEKYES